MITAAISFPNRLRLLRAQVYLSQEQFALALGFSRQTVNTIERGRLPTQEFIERVEKIFGIDLNSTNFYNELAHVNLPEAA